VTGDRGFAPSAVWRRIHLAGSEGSTNRLLALAAVLEALESRIIVVITTFMIDKLEINLYPIQQQSGAAYMARENRANQEERER
jgi:hypothetical protein